MNKDFKGVWIPKEIWLSNDLSGEAKLLYGIILLECDEKGVCLAMKSYLSNFYRVSVESIRNSLKELIECGYVKELNHEEFVSNVLKKKNLKNQGIGKRCCNWCNIKTFVLHEHHYPIPKSKGGTETVLICPNCHHEYHSIDFCVQINTSKVEGHSNGAYTN